MYIILLSLPLQYVLYLEDICPCGSPTSEDIFHALLQFSIKVAVSISSVVCLGSIETS